MTGWPPLLIVWAMFTLQPVTISVYPHVSMSPATFRITVLAPRHKDNRRMCLGYRVVGEREPLRNSCQDMAGELAERVRTVYWSIRTPGNYEGITELTRKENGKTRIYRSTQPFEVIGM